MAKTRVHFGVRFFLILLSFLGIIMAMTGILELLAGGIGSFYPPALRFPGYTGMLILCGYLLMMPMGWLYLRDAQSDES